jgi:hypothetical protein
VGDAAVQNLLDERDIRRVIYDYARGIDRMDLELVRGCYWPEATDVHGPFTGTRDEFISWVGPLLQRQTMTMHHLANVLIDVRGDDADVETYGVAYHSGGKTGDLRWNYAAGFRYVDRFQRRDGQWRIGDRVTVVEWVTPWDRDEDRTKVFGDRARRDRSDPVYASASDGIPS